MARPSNRSSANKIVHPAKRAFLTAYRQTGNIRASTDAANIARVTYYQWCEHDLVFAAAAQVAKEEYGDILEAKLSQLAVKHDNVTALIVALKMAGRFREVTRSELTGRDGGPVELDVDTRATLVSRITQLAARIGTPGLPEQTTE